MANGPAQRHQASSKAQKTVHRRYQRHAGSGYDLFQMLSTRWTIPDLRQFSGVM